MGGEDEEDYGALIYRESQLRKAEAAAAAKDDVKKKKKSSPDVSSTRPRRATSTPSTSAGNANSRLSVNGAHKRKASTRKRISIEDDEQAPRKAARKQYRKICSADGCTNIAQQGGVCKKHGAKAKQCSVEGCTNNVIKGGVCMKHGAKVMPKLCNVEGCTSLSRNGGVCMKHGAKVEYKRCSVEGCTNIAIKGGVCAKHGAKIAHKRCSSEGCTIFAQKGGVCIKHGAKVKLCSAEGCTRFAQKGGVCRRHSAYRNSTDESTAFTSCFGSDFDKTTLTRPNQRTSAASASQGSVPAEVAVRVIITNNHAEV